MEIHEVADSVRRLELMRRIRIRKQLSSFDLHPGQPQMLEYIRSHPGCNQKDVAKELDISPASAASSIKRLEKRGYIERSADEHDSRRNRIAITEKAVLHLTVGKEAFDSLDREMLDGLSEDELTLVKRLCEKMFDNLADETTRGLTVCRLHREAYGMPENNETEEK